jgi:hypothetical protein
MSNPSFTTTILVDQTPEQAFAAINNVRGWWSGDIEGTTDALGGVFTHRYEDVHRCRTEVAELVPGRRIAWHVLDNYFEFIKDKTEWKDTKIVFDIAQKSDKTQILFTHEGLVPEYECFNVCSNAWNSLMNDNLRSLIVTGENSPNQKRPGRLANLPSMPGPCRRVKL